jgi:hypothetical protein
MRLQTWGSFYVGSEAWWVLEYGFHHILDAPARTGDRSSKSGAKACWRKRTTSLWARVSMHAIRKCSFYVDLCRFQFNSTVECTLEGLNRDLTTKIIGSGLFKV